MSVRSAALATTMALCVAACSSASSTGAGSPPAPASGGVTAAVAAAAAATPPVRNIDPVGMYDVNLTAQGNPMAVNARIEKRADGSWGGQVTGDAIPPLPIKSVTVTGNTVKLVVTEPGGSDAFITMIVVGDDVSGDWSMTGDGSPITGKRRPR